MKLSWAKIDAPVEAPHVHAGLHSWREEFHPAEAAATPGAAAARATSLATLMGSHVLHDGELVLLILKPSFWFIVFNAASFVAGTAIVAILAFLLDHRMRGHFYLEAALFVIAGRLMWAVLQWMGRLYILTDLRVLRLSGIFSVQVFDCPLRKVARTRLVSPPREKLVGVGSIEIIPSEEPMPTAVWQTIAKPAEIHQRLVAAINRAKQPGTGCP